MGSIVYAVVNGEPETELAIEAVFSTREAAEKLKACDPLLLHIEEHEVDGLIGRR